MAPLWLLVEIFYQVFEGDGSIWKLVATAAAVPLSIYAIVGGCKAYVELRRLRNDGIGIAAPRKAAAVFTRARYSIELLIGSCLSLYVVPWVEYPFFNGSLILLVLAGSLLTLLNDRLGRKVPVSMGS